MGSGSPCARTVRSGLSSGRGEHALRLNPFPRDGDRFSLSPQGEGWGERKGGVPPPAILKSATRTRYLFVMASTKVARLLRKKTNPGLNA